MAVNYMEDGTRSEPAPSTPFTSPERSDRDATRWCFPMCREHLRGEAEMALVIGRRASNVKAANAMKHVFGYVNFIDGSARDLPPAGNTFYR